MVFSVEQTCYSLPSEPHTGLEVSSTTRPVLTVLEDKDEEEKEECKDDDDDNEEVLFLKLKENSGDLLQLTPQAGDDVVPLTGERCPRALPGHVHYWALCSVHI